MLHSMWLMICIILCLNNSIIHAMAPMEIDSKASYPKLLGQIVRNERDSLEALADDSNSLSRIHDWAFQHDPQSLKRGYQSLISRYSDRFCEDKYTLHHGEHDDSYSLFCNMLDRYAEIDREDMKRRLCYEIDAHIFTNFDEIPAPSFPFALLHLLKKRDPEEFEPIKNRMLKKLSSCLRLALSHPKRTADLQDELFNLNTLVRTGLTSKEHAVDALNDIVSQENLEHSEFLEQEIIAAVPTIFKEHYIRTSTLEKLLQSSSLKIRNSTLPALLLCITDNEQEEDKYKDAIDDIFECEALMPLQKEELYRPLFDSLQSADDCAKHYGMQRLIKRLAQDFITPFFIDVISSYFNSPKQDPDPNFIDKAFMYALEHKTLSLSQLNGMLLTARETGFENFLNTENRHKLKIMTILNENAITKDRVQFLDELLCEQHAKKEASSDLARQIEALPQSLFKQYARTLLLALNKSMHQTHYFAARSELFDFWKKHPDDFPNESQILRNLYKQLFIALREPTTYQKKSDQEPEPNYIHLEIRPNLSMNYLSFTESPRFFGYICENKDGKGSYRLCACNKKDGIPAWISTIESNKKHAYTVDSKYAYCATDDGDIAQIDLATGDLLQKLSIPDYQLKTDQLHVCGPDLICAVERKNLTLFNLKCGDFEIIALPEQSYSSNAITVGNRLIIPTKKSLFILESDGTHNEISHHSKGEFFDINRDNCTGTSEFIIYQKRDCDEKLHVACLGINSCNPLWELLLDHKIEQIQISPIHSTIFILTKYAVLALNPHADDEHRLLWQTKLTYNWGTEIDSIYITQDGSVLYGIKKSSGALFSFNVQNGQKNFLYEKHVGRVSEIVGDYNGKLYLQGITF